MPCWGPGTQTMIWLSEYLQKSWGNSISCSRSERHWGLLRSDRPWEICRMNGAYSFTTKSLHHMGSGPYLWSGQRVTAFQPFHQFYCMTTLGKVIFLHNRPAHTWDLQSPGSYYPPQLWETHFYGFISCPGILHNCSLAAWTNMLIENMEDTQQK